MSVSFEIASDDYHSQSYHGVVSTSFLRYIPEQDGAIHEWSVMTAEGIEWQVPSLS